MTKQNETLWTANMPYAPDAFTINMKNDTATVITLDKTEDMVDTAVVGVTTTADKPLYDLTTLKSQMTLTVKLQRLFILWITDRYFLPVWN